MNVPIKSGLKLKPRDKRNFSLKKHLPTFGALSDDLLSLGDSLNRTLLPVGDQGTTSQCTAYASAYAIAYRDNILKSPDYQYAKECEVNGVFTPDGIDASTTMKAGLIYGALNIDKVPSTIIPNNVTFNGNWNNWPKYLDTDAGKNRQESYFEVDGHYDVFDNIRVALKDSLKDNSVVHCFGEWFWEWQNVPNGIAPFPKNFSGFHTYLIVDYKTINGIPYLIGHLSQGQNFGDKGYIYFSREVINRAFKNVFKDGTTLMMYRKPNPSSIPSLERQRMSLFEIFLDTIKRFCQKLSGKAYTITT